MIIINMLIGLIIIAIVISTMYAIGRIVACICRLRELEFSDYLFVGFICIVGIGLLGLLAYAIGAEVTH